MKIETTRDDLFAPLMAAQSATDPSGRMPVLDSILFAYDPSRQLLELTGTNLETQITSYLRVQTEGQPGQVAVPAKKIADLLRFAEPEAIVRMTLEEDRLKLRIGSGRYTLKTLPADQFPRFDDAQWGAAVTLPAVSLLRAFRRVAFCAGKDDVRFYLNGVMLHLADDALLTVASDGHRLVSQSTPLEPTADLTESDRAPRIIPNGAMAPLDRILADSLKGAPNRQVTLRLGARDVDLQIIGGSGLPNLSFQCRLIESTYPDWRRILPKQFDSTLAQPGHTLAAAIARASVLADSAAKTIRFNVTPDLLILTSANDAQDSAEEHLPIELDGEPRESAYNARYLTEALKVVGTAPVTLAFSGQSLCVTEAGDPGWQAVIMAIRA